MTLGGTVASLGSCVPVGKGMGSHTPHPQMSRRRGQEGGGDEGETIGKGMEGGRR